MFADGVALEVDIDEERVEMVERDGSVVRSVLLLVWWMARLTMYYYFFADILYVNAVRAGRSATV
jgi:hypothetical protein